LEATIGGQERVINNTIILHVVLGDFNNIFDNKIDRSLSTSQMDLYDIYRAFYPYTPLFTHEKWTRTKVHHASYQNQGLIKSGSYMSLMLFR
jgi:hypothetical protein